jgi:hypothetical protein
LNGESLEPRIPNTLSRFVIFDNRYADDAGMNRELREVDRWNDPAAEFLTVS